MLNNHTYDLLAQLAEEHRSLWRMREMYESDSDRCPECQVFWQRQEEEKLKNVAELEELLKNHLMDADNYHDEPDLTGKKVSFIHGPSSAPASVHAVHGRIMGKQAHLTETGRKSVWQPAPV